MGGRGQFLQTCQSEALQERFSCGEAQPAVGTGKFLHKPEIPEFHDEPALVGIEKPVDFRLADWLPKGDARQHFKGRRRHLKISARATLFAHICAQRLVFDPGSQQRNHPIENPQLKADKGELLIAGKQRGYQLHVTERRHGAVFGARHSTKGFGEPRT